uniref:6-phosphogluconate dehydrogenase NADP-binding domain-containing protein n=1 Tax=Ananas comosus var. bracteatus TaxID=296719 RepID=A0A6V7NZA5_ANACO|nr:unnamed protein product [Ananas comosus var. bracteatus]
MEKEGEEEGAAGVERGYPVEIRPGSTRIGWIGVGVMAAPWPRASSPPGTTSPSTRARRPRRRASPAPARAWPRPRRRRRRERRRVHDGRPPRRRARRAARPRVRRARRAPRGGVLVDCTSSDPALARAVAAAARAKGCWAVDAPVSGGDVGAREGTLAILAGGDERVVAWLAPLLGRLGRATWMGAPGTGQSAKIANQIAVAGAVVGAAEAASFARAAGLDAATFMEAVGAGGGVEGGGDLRAEDGGEGLHLGGVEEAKEEEDDDDEKEKGAVVVLPGAALFQKLFLGMVANGDGKLGMQGVITVIERMNGL